MSRQPPRPVRLVDVTGRRPQPPWLSSPIALAQVADPWRTPVDLPEAAPLRDREGGRTMSKVHVDNVRRSNAHAAGPVLIHSTESTTPTVRFRRRAGLEARREAWWTGAGSNRRPSGFQVAILP